MHRCLGSSLSGWSGRKIMTKRRESEGKRILEVMHEAVRYTEAVFDLIKQAKPPAAENILEFGAGDGTFITRFRVENVSIDVVEPDGKLRTLLQREGCRVFQDIREVESETCDFIYTVNVLE